MILGCLHIKEEEILGVEVLLLGQWDQTTTHSPFRLPQ